MCTGEREVVRVCVVSGCGVEGARGVGDRRAVPARVGVVAATDNRRNTCAKRLEREMSSVCAFVAVGVKMCVCDGVRMAVWW